MCHGSVLAWAAALFTPAIVEDKTVVEVGSYNVNGSVRPYVERYGPTSYLGVDFEKGPGVDLVANVDDLSGMYPEGFDVVISTEMLEHVEDWRSAIYNLVRLVKPGGVLVMSTRSPGFPYHPFPVDNWRYPVPVMRQIVEAADLDIFSLGPDPEAPGVFAFVGKPADWFGGADDWLTDIEVPRV